MDLSTTGEGFSGPPLPSEQTLRTDWAASHQPQGVAALGASTTMFNASHQTPDYQPRPQAPPRRADTPCPAKFQRDRKILYVLVPYDSRRFIALRAGKTVVGRGRRTGIRDQHVSRRHVEVTVPEKGTRGSQEGYCRIKYIGRNCHAVVVGGIWLKPGQEVPAGPGTIVTLNHNNKGLTPYSYTLIPANTLPALARIEKGKRQAAETTTSRRREPDSALDAELEASAFDAELEDPIQQRQLDEQYEKVKKMLRRMQPLTQSLLTIKQRRLTWHFRKEAQDKLQREREEIFKKFGDLKFE